MVSVVNIRPTIQEVIGEDYDIFEKFDKNAKGRTSYVQQIKKKKTEIRKTFLRPTQIANKYVQGLI